MSICGCFQPIFSLLEVRHQVSKGANSASMLCCMIVVKVKGGLDAAVTNGSRKELAGTRHAGLGVWFGDDDDIFEYRIG